MFKYAVKRILIGMVTLLILSTITFFGIRAMPGDPFTQDNKVISPETYAAMEAKLANRSLKRDNRYQISSSKDFR